MKEMIPVLSRWLVANCTSVKSSTLQKVSVKVYNLRVPVFKEVPLPWLKWNPSFSDVWWRNIRVWNVWISEKWVLNYTTWGFPFLRGFRFPWMKWYMSFSDDWWRNIRVSKSWLSEKWVLKYTTLGFPFLKGFPYHEWNETRSLTMIGGQLYECEKFHFLKVSVKVCNCRVPV